MLKKTCKVIHIKQQNTFITSSALDIIQSSYYIHGPLGDENIFAVLYVSLCYGPYTLLQNNFYSFLNISICSFFTNFTSQAAR